MRALASVLLFALVAGCSDEPKSRPNVLLISIDSLRADHLGCYGYERATSPSIDRLAAEGVRFETAVSTTSWTLPAHAALFTGLYDSTHGVVDNGLKLSDEHRTLAEALRDVGYRTAGFYGGPYLHPMFGLGQGFDEYVNCMGGVDDANVESQSHAHDSLSHKDVTGPRTVEAVERWLGTWNGEAPCFLFVHLWDVHYDYLPPAEYVEQFDPGYEGTVTGEHVMSDPAIAKEMPARDLAHLVALYDGEIRFTDDQVARLLELLRARGELDDTVVIVTADHGEEFFEHGGKGHQRTLFEEVLRVPLVVHWPKKFAPRVVRDPVRLIDVLPTVITLAGESKRPRTQGRDLTPLLLGDSLPQEPALCELLVDGGDLRALRTATAKFVRLTNPDGLQGGLAFDLARDPREQRPLDHTDAAQAERMRQGLTRLQEVVASAAGFATAGADEVEVDEAMLERLRRLGYVGDD